MLILLVLAVVEHRARRTGETPPLPGLQLGTGRFCFTRSRRLPISAARVRMHRQTCLSMNGQIYLLSIMKVIHHGLHGLCPSARD